MVDLVLTFMKPCFGPTVIVEKRKLYRFQSKTTPRLPSTCLTAEIIMTVTNAPVSPEPKGTPFPAARRAIVGARPRFGRP